MEGDTWDLKGLISELILQLENIKKEHGDIPVRVNSMSHTWNVEPEVKERNGIKFVLLNP